MHYCLFYKNYPEITKFQKCLLPAYTCDTIVLHFIVHGWEIEFYQIDSDLQIEIHDLKELLR